MKKALLEGFRLAVQPAPHRLAELASRLEQRAEAVEIRAAQPLLQPLQESLLVLLLLLLAQHRHLPLQQAQPTLRLPQHFPLEDLLYKAKETRKKHMDQRLDLDPLLQHQPRQQSTLRERREVFLLLERQPPHPQRIRLLRLVGDFHSGVLQRCLAQKGKRLLRHQRKIRNRLHRRLVGFLLAQHLAKVLMSKLPRHQQQEGVSLLAKIRPKTTQQ
mmetsp:Transcript_14937/g.22806  ORF Transcript_14937/g.22806 Transcript_14937/m.22806 type:complete len:216 (+) Transcript_14937:216-863(+)